MFGTKQEAELEIILASMPKEYLPEAFNVLTSLAAKRNNKMTKGYLTKLRKKL